MGIEEIPRKAIIIMGCRTLGGDGGNRHPLHLCPNDVDTNPDWWVEKREPCFPDRFDRALGKGSACIELRDQDSEEVEGRIMTLPDPVNDLKHIFQAIDTKISHIDGNQDVCCGH